MTTSNKQRELGLKALERPRGYSNLPARSQWHVDSILGILDWNGTGLTKDEMKQLKELCLWSGTK